MKLSMQKKAYLLIVLNFVFLFLLFLWTSDIRVEKNGRLNLHKNFKPTKVLLVNHATSSNFLFLQGEDTNWTLNFEKNHCRANEHALAKLFHDSSLILSFKPANGPIDFHNLLWSITFSGQKSELAQFEVFEDGTQVTRSGQNFYYRSNELNEFLSKNFESFVDEQLWDGNVHDIRFLKIKTSNLEETFVKKNSTWHMELPFNRPVSEGFIGNILKFLSNTHCNTIVFDQKISPKEVTLSMSAADRQSNLSFFSKNDEIFVKKEDMVFKVLPEFSVFLKKFLERSLKLFSDIRFDSLEIQGVSNQKRFFLQKLEGVDKWQLSLSNDNEVNFLEISDEKVASFENLVSDMSVQNRLDKLSDGCTLDYSLKINSNIGVANFQIFEDERTGNWFLLHSESGFVFKTSHEFVEKLRDMTENCGQNYERDSSGTGS